MQPYLEQLAQDTDESCPASILEGTDIVYVARASQRRVMSTGLNVGSRLPAYCASMGRVLPAALPERERIRLLEATARPKLTEKTLTEMPASRPGWPHVPGWPPRYTRDPGGSGPAQPGGHGNPGGSVDERAAARRQPGRGQHGTWVAGAKARLAAGQHEIMDFA